MRKILQITGLILMFSTLVASRCSKDDSDTKDAPAAETDPLPSDVTPDDGIPQKDAGIPTGDGSVGDGSDSLEPEVDLGGETDAALEGADGMTDSIDLDNGPIGDEPQPEPGEGADL